MNKNFLNDIILKLRAKGSDEVDVFYYESNNKIVLGQYAFGAQRNNEFIKYLIENIHNNIELITQKFTNYKYIKICVE